MKARIGEVEEKDIDNFRRAVKAETLITIKEYVEEQLLYVEQLLTEEDTIVQARLRGKVIAYADVLEKLKKETAPIPPTSKEAGILGGSL